MSKKHKIDSYFQTAYTSRPGVEICNTLIQMGMDCATAIVRSRLRCSMDKCRKRWGGEEFLIILPNVTPEGLEAIANRVRVFISQSYLMVEKDKVVVTASLGATLARADDTATSMIERADTLMYNSKTSGRNQVTFG